MDELLERIEASRADADWAVRYGKDHDHRVHLSREDCDEIAAILTKAFGVCLTGKRDPDLADSLALLSGAFEGDGDNTHDDA